MTIKREKGFVQFLHPGGESITDYVSETPGRIKKGESYHHWNKDDAINTGLMPSNKGPHRRKFIKNKGQYLDKDMQLSEIKDIMFIGEWEMPSRFNKIKYPVDCKYSGYSNSKFCSEKVPQYIHNRLLVETSKTERENTDPYVFGNKFGYSVCRQKIEKNPNKLYKLDINSLILFGSNFQKKFILDTVFVVSDSVLYSVHSDKMIEEIKNKYNLKNIFNIGQVREKYKLSDTFVKGGLEPLQNGNSVNISHSDFYNLYLGATYKYPIKIKGEKIFSYFPCTDYKEGTAFERPVISFEDYPEIKNQYSEFKFKDKKTMGYSITLVEKDDQILNLWKNVKNQVLSQGCKLGVWTEEPISK